MLKAIDIKEESFRFLIEEEKDFIVDFYAPWCGPCKKMCDIIDEAASENKQLKIFKLNIDDLPGIAAEFEVLSIPTVVYFKEGKPVHRTIGLCKKEEISENIKEYL